MEAETFLIQIIRRLDVLIALQLELASASQSTPVAGKIQRLAQLGLSTSEIAKILQKKPNYVTATLSRLKKTHKVRRGKKT